MTSDEWQAAPLRRLLTELLESDTMPRTLLSVRISPDSGKTWYHAVTVTDENLPPLMTQTWPPCECPLCGA